MNKKQAKKLRKAARGIAAFNSNSTVEKEYKRLKKIHKSLNKNER